MDFAPSPRALDYATRMQAFLDEVVLPHEETYARQTEATAAQGAAAPIMEEMKAEARRRGLWNLFMMDERWGPGLSNLDHAPLAEVSGRSWMLAPEATNCSAPDSGNMELLALFGTPDQQERWMHPLLNGEIRSAFAMTEPQVASSDPTNLQSTIVLDGDDYVLNGEKWFISGLLDPRCRFVVFMGKTDTSAPAHQQQSMVLVPVETPGITIEGSLSVFGYHYPQGHAQARFEDVRVPRDCLLGEEGAGFAMSQARLGPGRIHQCMRALGMGEYALQLMIDRAEDRAPFGQPLVSQGIVQTWIAEARINLDQARLLVLKTAWLLDTVGVREARTEISAIKAVVPKAVLEIIDRAIQVHGGAGVSQHTPLARMYSFMRTIRIGDGPDEVHLRGVARREISRRNRERGTVT